MKATLFRTFCSNLYCGHLWHDFRKSALRQLIVGYITNFRFLIKFHRNCSTNGMLVFDCVPSFMEIWRNYIGPYMVLHSAYRTVLTLSSLPLSHSAECHPIFGNDGIVYYTRRLNLIRHLHTVFVDLIPLCLCDTCCIVYLYMGLHHCFLA